MNKERSNNSNKKYQRNNENDNYDDNDDPSTDDEDYDSSDFDDDIEDCYKYVNDDYDDFNNNNYDQEDDLCNNDIQPFESELFDIIKSQNYTTHNWVEKEVNDKKENSWENTENYFQHKLIVKV